MCVGGELDLQMQLSKPAAASIASRASIGPPTKHHSNGVSWAGRWSSAVMCLLVFGRVQCKLTPILAASCKLVREPLLL